MKFTRQFDRMDCGPACIRMVASHYGKDYPLSYLRSLSHLTREGVAWPAYATRWGASGWKVPRSASRQTS